MFEEVPIYNLYNVSGCFTWKVGNVELIKEIWYALELGCNSHQEENT